LKQSALYILNVPILSRVSSPLLFLLMFPLIFPLLFPLFLKGAIYEGPEAEALISGSTMVQFDEASGVPGFIRFRVGKRFRVASFKHWAKKAFDFGEYDDLKLLTTFDDTVGYTHYRYQQTYAGYPVLGGVYTVHAKKEKVISISGKFFKNINAARVPLSDKKTCLSRALNYVDAEKYQWQLTQAEAFLKKEQNDSTATYYPAGKLVLAPVEGQFQSRHFRLTWCFDIYASQPLYRADVYVDAISGKIVFENSKIHTANATGTAVTAYSGTQSIVTDSYLGSYRLRETTRGNGIATFDLNTSTNYFSAVDFTDADNFWNNFNPNLDQYATDAHWGAEKTYDYFSIFLGRNSIDDNGMALLSYVHFGTNFVNAFWDGQRMTYGDGNGTYTSLVALDIVAHEITHGVTNHTANLFYSYESGALNESFSDIFGTVVEFYAKPGTANWLLGEDIGTYFRSLANPNLRNDPDTYQGSYWYNGPNDNGGVHINSGVQNFWFYLLTNGGSGINDLGNSFSVAGIGIDKAAAIAYRNLTVYLSPSSQYVDARFYAIQSAIDLFGPCTAEVIATTNAWHAVGIGATFSPTVTASFIAPIPLNCDTPFTVQFINQSTNGGTFFWDFGDGNTDTTSSPAHTYTTYGRFTVSLIANGGPCGSDTMIRVDYIEINPNNTCVVTMPLSGKSPVITTCIGVLYDNGGPAANYLDEVISIVTIAPPNALNITLSFSQFHYEANYDYLFIYDGPDTFSTLIGQYDGTNMPNGGIITTSGNTVTLKHFSDLYVNELGFEMSWTCNVNISPPITLFTAVPLNSCIGEIQFSQYNPTTWLWDFGDGQSSVLQHPTHTYMINGSYTVKLRTSNSYGSDSLIRIGYITVNRPAAPATTDGQHCGPGAVNLSATGNGILQWYAAPTGGFPFNTGGAYITPLLTADTTFYVENQIVAPIQKVGPVYNNIGVGGYYSGNRHLVFDVYAPATLVSVKVYANSSAARTIELRNSSGAILQSVVATIPSGTNRINLNFQLSPGTDYQLGVAGTGVDLFRNSSGGAFPYTIPGLLSIIGTNAPLGYYYFFYDWEVQAQPCRSVRTAVTARIFTPPMVNVVTANESCTPGGDGMADASIVGNGPFLFSWSNGATTEDISATSTGSYYISTTDANNCIAIDTINVGLGFPAGPPGTFTWTGAHGADWFTPCNWDKVAVPDSLADVVIPAAIPAPVISGDTAHVKSLLIDVNGGANITIDVMNGGALRRW